MRWLDRHDTALPLAGPTDARAVWLTGQSSWSRSDLSPAQDQVLDDLAALGWDPLRAGFPWTEASAGSPASTPIVVASLRNTAQALAARPGSRFADQVAQHLQPLLDLTSSRLLLLCGSAGAQMLACAVPRLHVPPGLRIQVVGLGPVGRLPAAGGAWQVHVVRGERDRISRWGYRGRDDSLVPGGHMTAATSPAARQQILAVAGPAS